MSQSCSTWTICFKSQLLTPCSHGGLSLSVPPSSLAWGSSIKALSVWVHIGWQVEGCSGGLLSRGVAHSVWLCDFANIVISRGTVGGVLHMFNQNRHYWTPLKGLGSIAASTSDGSPPTIWRHFLWTSGGWAMMRNEPWVRLVTRVPGRAAQEQWAQRPAQMMG